REKPRGYARAVTVGDQIYVSGCTSLSSTGEVRAAGGWAGPFDLAGDTIRWALRQGGAPPHDLGRPPAVPRPRAPPHRPYRGGPGRLAMSYPASLGCRISGLARPELLVEIEVTAVKGAGAGIEWIGPDATDPLDAA